MFGLGIPELIIIFVIALLVFGPKKLPDLGKSIGRAMAEFKKASDEFQDSVRTEMRDVEKQVDLEEVKKLGRIDLGGAPGPEEPKKTNEEAVSSDGNGEHDGKPQQESGEAKNG